MMTFDTDPARYRHWRLHCEGALATLALDVAEEGGLSAGYRLKLNSYDLGVDIELADALERIRFEHPQVRVVVITGGKERVFCAGANIAMLAQASHADKIEFCRFTNETRNAIEDASRHSGLKFIAAVNGVCAGGGYELALACDEILMVDDRSTTLSLPEVALLGVLPGTGGLTRLTDKRKVRRDLADVFATAAEGVRAGRARDWKLVDHIAPPAAFAGLVAERAGALAAGSDRPAGVEGVALAALERHIDAEGYRYRRVDVRLDRGARRATLTVAGPGPADIPDGLAGILAAGARWWPLEMARELDDALLLLRANEREIGTLVLQTRGDPALVLKSDALMDQGSCFAGSLFELALAADRSYMLAGGEGPPRVALGPLEFGGLEMANGRTRLQTRFHDEAAALAALAGRLLDAAAAERHGLVTFAPDELDWDDEIRLALEERASLSPDALAGLEANLRFAGPETLATRIMGRLSAWQNWIFLRPNATGPEGALRCYGSGKRPRFAYERL